MTIPDSAALTQEKQNFAAGVVNSADILDENAEQAVTQAICSVSRSDFLQDSYKSRSLDDSSIPIDYGQYTERPTLIARVLGLSGIVKGSRVLEIGTGSGYSAALMSEMGAYVFSMERLGLLAQDARKRLDSFGFVTNETDFSFELMSQMDLNARLIAPVGELESRLVLFENTDDGIQQYALEEFII